MTLASAESVKSTYSHTLNFGPRVCKLIIPVKNKNFAAGLCKLLEWVE
jgi:hypothetical protein